MSLPDFDALARGYAARTPAPHALALRLEELRLVVRSNNAALVRDLAAYFAPFVAQAGSPGESAAPDLEFLFLDGPVEAPPVELAVRQPLPGKKPDKERFADLPGAGLGAGLGAGGGGRLVRKQATGMLFLFGAGGGANMAPNSALNIAMGPCAQNRNQLVNFLCARYMERRVAQGWVLGHASGVARTGADGARALALCGFAGMGKSTLALHLVARGLDFVSNDRVLVQGRDLAPSGVPLLHGIPKHPRLNPGTALGNPELAPLLSCALPEAKRAAYAHLDPAALRLVEDKYDACIDVCFGAGAGQSQGLPQSLAASASPKESRFRLAAPLVGVAVLNWRHGEAGFLARRVDLGQRPDLLEALRKPPGVFYLPGALRSRGEGGAARLTAAECLEALAGVPVLELAGGADFSAATAACLELLG